MMVIGIDPGTASTGYGVVRLTEREVLELVDCGVIHTAPNSSLPDRLRHLHEGLMGLLRRHRPETSAVETLYHQRSLSSAMAVGHARGVVLLTLAQCGIPVEEYAPRAVKEAVAGYGGASKQQVQEMVRVLLGLDSPPRSDHAADALAVAICHLHTSQIRRRLEGVE